MTDENGSQRVHFMLTKSQHAWFKEQKYLTNKTGQEIMTDVINCAMLCDLFDVKM